MVKNVMMAIKTKEMDVIIVNYKMVICVKMLLGIHHNASNVEIIVMNVITNWLV